MHFLIKSSFGLPWSFHEDLTFEDWPEAKKVKLQSSICEGEALNMKMQRFLKKGGPSKLESSPKILPRKVESSKLEPSGKVESSKVVPSGKVKNQNLPKFKPSWVCGLLSCFAYLSTLVKTRKYWLWEKSIFTLIDCNFLTTISTPHTCSLWIVVN